MAKPHRHSPLALTPRLWSCARPVALGLTLAWAGACAAQAGAALEVPDMLAGIVHYTRWPDAMTSLHLCVSDKDPSAAAAITHRFSEGAEPPSPVTVVSLRIDGAAIARLLECQAIYFGQTPVATWRPLLPELAKHSILTIGHGEEFCSFGGLFCLDSAAPGARLRANLDSIARVGLRVNPQLLRFTQRERTQ